MSPLRPKITVLNWLNVEAGHLRGESVPMPDRPARCARSSPPIEEIGGRYVGRVALHGSGGGHGAGMSGRWMIQANSRRVSVGKGGGRPSRPQERHDGERAARVPREYGPLARPGVRKGTTGRSLDQAPPRLTERQ